MRALSGKYHYNTLLSFVLDSWVTKLRVMKTLKDRLFIVAHGEDDFFSPF